MNSFFNSPCVGTVPVGVGTKSQFKSVNKGSFYKVWLFLYEEKLHVVLTNIPNLLQKEIQNFDVLMHLELYLELVASEQKIDEIMNKDDKGDKDGHVKIITA